MVDIHTHILPGLDDGARDYDTALTMARLAVEDGIEALVATPHVLKGFYDNHREQIIEQVEKFNQLLIRENIILEVLPGAEYFLEADLPQRLAAGQLLTINDSGRYLLVELPADIVPEYTTTILYELQIQGITPIIAHPERNITLAQKPWLLKDLNARGVLSQITSGSVTGLFGKGIKKTALQFLKQGLGQLIASDAHSADGRAPRLALAAQVIEAHLGPQAAGQLVEDNPRAICSGSHLEPQIPSSLPSLWEQLFKRWSRRGIS